MLPGPDSLGLHNMMGVLVRLHISTIDNDNEGTSASPQRIPKEELQSTKQSEAADAQERLTNDSEAKRKTTEHQTLTQQLTASPLKQLRPDAAHFKPAQVTPVEVVSDPFAIQNSCDCCGHAGHRAHPYPTSQAPPMYDSGRFYSPGNSMAYAVCPDGRHMAISALTPVRVARPEDARKNVRESMQHLITMPKPSFMWTHPLLGDFYAQQFGNIPRGHVIENGVELPTMPQGGWLPNLHNSTHRVSPVYDSYQKTVTKPEITQKSLTNVATSNSVQNTSKKPSSSSSRKPHASNNLQPPEKSVQVSKKPSGITGEAKTSKGDKFATALQSAMKAVGVVLEKEAGEKHRVGQKRDHRPSAGSDLPKAPPPSPLRLRSESMLLPQPIPIPSSTQAAVSAPPTVANTGKSAKQPDDEHAGKCKGTEPEAAIFRSAAVETAPLTSASTKPGSSLVAASQTPLSFENCTSAQQKSILRKCKSQVLDDLLHGDTSNPRQPIDSVNTLKQRTCDEVPAKNSSPQPPVTPVRKLEKKDFDGLLSNTSSAAKLRSSGKKITPQDIRNLPSRTPSKPRVGGSPKARLLRSPIQFKHCSQSQQVRYSARAKNRRVDYSRFESLSKAIASVTQETSPGKDQHRVLTPKNADSFEMEESKADATVAETTLVQRRVLRETDQQAPREESSSSKNVSNQHPFMGSLESLRGSPQRFMPFSIPSKECPGLPTTSLSWLRQTSAANSENTHPNSRHTLQVNKEETVLQPKNNTKNMTVVELEAPAVQPKFVTEVEAAAEEEETVARQQKANEKYEISKEYKLLDEENNKKNADEEEQILQPRIEHVMLTVLASSKVEDPIFTSDELISWD